MPIAAAAAPGALAVVLGVLLACASPALATTATPLASETPPPMDGTPSATPDYYTLGIFSEDSGLVTASCGSSSTVSCNACRSLCADVNPDCAQESFSCRASGMRDDLQCVCSKSSTDIVVPVVAVITAVLLVACVCFGVLRWRRSRRDKTIVRPV